MPAVLILAAGFLALGVSRAADVPVGDARRGEQLFLTQHCVQCHSFQGKGGRSAPDLARRINRDYTPAVLASLMWNHAPAMWEGMRKAGLQQPSLSPEAAADLFAYFVSARYFEKPGDAGRGKQAFAANHCADCHGIASPVAGGGPPVAKWESLADPVVLAQQMWNHAAGMQKAFAAKGLKWPQVTAQELTDILVYLQNLPETRGLAANFSFPPSADGQQLFESKGCAKCHTGRLALESRLRNATLTEIAAAMWNHAQHVEQPPQLDQEQMRRIVGYIWARQYFRQAGDAGRGKRVFAGKGCATCHNDPSSGAPSLAKGKDTYSDITIISALWSHGPRMLESMRQKKMEWPRFTAQQMSDLIAYLNSM
jgi:mono/diheme cytochrome c family protein